MTERDRLIVHVGVGEVIEIPLTSDATFNAGLERLARRAGRPVTRLAAESDDENYLTERGRAV